MNLFGFSTVLHFLLEVTAIAFSEYDINYPVAVVAVSLYQPKTVYITSSGATVVYVKIFIVGFSKHL